VTGVTLPAATGPIGPFMIYTRKVQNGQIADMTRGFGSIYVTDTFTTTTMALSLVEGADV